jgi:hypothetical protein
MIRRSSGNVRITRGRCRDTVGVLAIVLQRERCRANTPPILLLAPRG